MGALSARGFLEGLNQADELTTRFVIGALWEAFHLVMKGQWQLIEQY